MLTGGKFTLICVDKYVLNKTGEHPATYNSWQKSDGSRRTGALSDSSVHVSIVQTTLICASAGMGTSLNSPVII
jgi:hypothetical protein